MYLIMTYGESHGPEQDRASINLKMAEATRDSVDSLCMEIIDSTYDLLQSKVRIDAEEIEMYGDIGAPRGVEVPIYVCPDSVHAPMIDDEPVETLTILFERAQPDEGSDNASGDQIRLYFPVPKNYTYPAALPDDYKPVEVYVEFIPNAAKHEERVFFIIQPNPLDVPRNRYALYAYDSAAVAGEEKIYDALSDEKLHDGLLNRIPEDIELASSLIRRLGNFDIVHQENIGRPQSDDGDEVEIIDLR